jgi:hypothetical protein
MAPPRPVNLSQLKRYLVPGTRLSRRDAQGAIVGHRTVVRAQSAAMILLTEDGVTKRWVRWPPAHDVECTPTRFTIFRRSTTDRDGQPLPAGMAERVPHVTFAYDGLP